MVILAQILFPDEVHFELGGYVNKQNRRLWATKDAKAYIESFTQNESLFGADFGPEA